MKIPALSLWQPYASLVALQEKRIETRSFYTSIRGPVAIHACKKWDEDCWGPCEDGPIADALDRHKYWKAFARRKETPLPLGAILCVMELIDCRKMLQDKDGVHLAGESFGAHGYAELVTPKEMAFGDWHPGRYGMVFGKMLEEFAEPIPARGCQQFGWPWEWSTCEAGKAQRK